MITMTTNQNKTTLDIEWTKAKFSEERDKRLGSPNARQYQNLSPKEAKDPWKEQKQRPPVKDHVKFTFVGGGWSGLLTGAELAKKGITDVRIVDRAGDFGGVWYWNRYPGLMCDSPALIYLPLLEETGHVPTEKYAHQPEILAHAQRIGRCFNLYEKALFHTGVTAARWDEARQVWCISTDRGDEFTSDFFGLGTGLLSTPKLPSIDGIGKFKGKSFHAARWDYKYTGGGPNQALSNLADKRVGIIGTGATAIQLLSPVAQSAKQTFVFQRTPSAVHPRNNAAMDPEYFKSIAKPGWQKTFNQGMVDSYAGLLGQPYSLAPTSSLFEGDAFSEIFGQVRDVILSVAPDKRTPENVMAAIEANDVKAVADNHQHIDNIVNNQDTANSLKPWYRPVCKRPTFNDDYLQAYNLPGTHLVDTDGAGVTEITESGVIANGKEFPLDCIIFASGFEFAKNLLHGIKFDIQGLHGVSLHDYWQEGVRSYHGMHVDGFPNMFILQLAQGADFAPNIPTGMQNAAEVISGIVGHMQSHELSSVRADKAYEDAWTSMICNALPMPDLRDCTPGLLSHEGSSNPKVASYQGYPDGPRAFFTLIQTWLASGEFEGLSFSA